MDAILRPSLCVPARENNTGDNKGKKKEKKAERIVFHEARSKIKISSNKNWKARLNKDIR